MTETASSATPDPKMRSNRAIAIACVAFFTGMVGMAYAAVPLYDLFCRVTGFGGTTQRTDQYSDVILDRDIEIRFDANVAGGMPWEFEPAQRSTTLKIGETTQVSYTSRNVAQRPVMGTASFNVTPELAGAYFMKVECFCFTETELQPGETMDMPVVFYVDPKIVEVAELKDIKTITLSYTFFPTAGAQPVAARAGDDDTQADTEFGG